MVGPSKDGFRQRPGWLGALALVLLGQGMLALCLFGPSPGSALQDDRPILAGKHPLHLYHGTLGAQTFADRFATACYDPAFQAGYPKTPVFDGGCRPAELALIFTSCMAPASAYKYSLVVWSLLAPLAFGCSARGAGGSPRAAVIAASAGALFWWTAPVRVLFDSGDLDLLLAGLCGVVGIGACARYHREPGPTSWFVLAAISIAGWYAHPVIWLGLLPILVVYYLALAPRHGPAWHLGLLGSIVIGITTNAWWLIDWARFWWLREQTALADAPAPPGAREVASDPAGILALLGSGPFGWILAVLGLAACGVLARTRRRTPAWLYAGTLCCTVTLARVGQLWPPVQMMGLERVALFASAIALVPIAVAVSTWWERALLGLIPTWAVILSPLVIAYLGGAPARTMGLQLEPLTMGFNPDQQLLVEALRTHTTPDARILIEEINPTRPGWNWTALLPQLTGRAYLGGLDGEACVEHGYCGLKPGRLAERAIGSWTDAELAVYCNTYNVGWVLARSEAAITRWQAWPAAKAIGTYQDHGPAVLFAIARPKTFVLAGTATVEQADRKQIVLTDVTAGPDGVVLLSFHYQPGLRIAPPSVLAEPAKDATDPIPLLRLRLTTPQVSRVTIRWENR